MNVPIMFWSEKQAWQVSKGRGRLSPLPVALPLESPAMTLDFLLIALGVLTIVVL